MLGKRIILLLYLMICHQVVVEAQKEASNWVFGGFAGVNFSCSVPQIFPTPFDGLEGGASISSPSGELLFLTNGDAVWSKDFRVMPNGRDIGGLCTGYGNYASASQSSLIVPHPGNPDLYYLFTTDCAEDNFVGGLRYSVVDMSMNGGFGDVIEKNQPLVALTGEKIAAVFQPNGTDVWVVTHGVLSNTFYAYSITGAGLNLIPVISNTGQVHPGGRGYLKFSPDGYRLVATCFQYGFFDGISTEIFHFDLNTGKVTSDFILPTGSKSDYAASFSPNGKVLYTSCSWTCWPTIEQFNLEAGTPQEIFDQRYTIETPGIYGAMQLGIDGKLYYLSSESSSGRYLSAIQSPNAVGAACNLLQKYVALPCWAPPSWGLPNYIESYFLSPPPGPSSCQPMKKDLIENFDFTPVVDCEDLSVAIDNESSVMDMELVTQGLTRVAIVWQFDFGDGMQYNSASVEDVNHTYANPGTYTITLSVWQFSCQVRTIQKVIEILPVQSRFHATQDCKSRRMDFINETMDYNQPLQWNWNFGDNSPDHTSNAKSPTHTYAIPGTYTVTLTTTSSCNSSTVAMTIDVRAPFTVSLGNDATFCFDQSLTLSTDRPGDSYRWNTGEVSSTIAISMPGSYWVQVSVGNCTVSDTINVTYRDCVLCQTPIHTLSLGDDVTICEEDVIHYTVDPAIVGDILWSNGFTERSMDVNAPGKYWVSVVSGNCHVADTVNVTPAGCLICNPSLQDLNVGSDTTICESDAVNLIIPNTILGDVLWSSGSTERSIDVTDPGTYWVKVSNGECQASDSLTVATRDCWQCNAFIPNIISPNGDGKNDEFSFSADCDYYSFRMDIYNRWGNRMLTVSLPTWNGFIGNEMAFGIYYFTIQYSFTGPQSRVLTHQKKGWVQVVR